MSKRQNFLRWLRQWKPPEATQTETEKVPVAEPTTKTNTAQCPWCLEHRTADEWNPSEPIAWQLHCKEDEGYYLVCNECRKNDRIWAVGTSGLGYPFGTVLDAVPLVADDFGILLQAFPAGQLFDHNMDPQA